MRSLFRKIREANRPFCTALVAAAGSSSRMGGVNKLLQPLDGISGQCSCPDADTNSVTAGSRYR